MWWYCEGVNESGFVLIARLDGGGTRLACMAAADEGPIRSSLRRFSEHLILRNDPTDNTTWVFQVGRIMSSSFEIQPIGRFVEQSAAIKRPRVCFPSLQALLFLNRLFP